MHRRVVFAAYGPALGKPIGGRHGGPYHDVMPPIGPALRLLVLVALAAPATAQVAPPDGPCPFGEAQAWLYGADVQAVLFTNGNLFFGNRTTSGDGYLTPTRMGASHSPMFAANLWVGGRVGGEVRTASARYNGFEFRPGQTGPDGTPPDSTACSAADRVWVLAQEWMSAGPEADPMDDIRDWPVHLGAPVVDGDGDPDNYDLAAGDRPALRGGATAFWAMTDTAAERHEEDEAPLGIDATVEASAFGPGALAATTVYHVTVTNRNAVPIEDAYVGFWADPDLGNSGDDYVGTDTTGHMAFAYNANDTDAVYGVPPAVGVVVAEGPLADANGRDDDRDGEADEPGERMGLTAAPPIEKSGPTETVGEPIVAEEVYNRLQGLWSDGSPVYAYANGYEDRGVGAPTTVFAYPGDPVTGAFWSEENNDGEGTHNNTRDIRMLASTGPFHLEPGASEEVTFAVVFARGADRLDSVVELRELARAVRRAAEAGGFEPVTLRTLPEEVVEPEVPLSVRQPYPNPFHETAVVEVAGHRAGGGAVRVSVYDVLGRRVSADVAGGDGRVEVGRGLPSGVYVIRVEGAGFEETFSVTKVRLP